MDGVTLQAIGANGDDSRLLKSSPNPDYESAHNPTCYVDQMGDGYRATPRRDEASIHLCIDGKLANRTMRWILSERRSQS
jgi:hypothetical protein